jgi:hypothetical protein
MSWTTRRPIPWCLFLLAVLGLLGPSAPEARAQAADLSHSRQVTLFGIVATPHSRTMDRRLKAIEPQLRKLLPGYGFKLLDVQSKRLAPGESVVSDFKNGFVVETELTGVLDANGKVQLSTGLWFQGELQNMTMVATPPNQLFFLDKGLDNGSRLLIGIGAR